LTQDMLNVENELVLINATVSWARCEAQRRGIAGDDAGVRAVLKPCLLSLLRFLTLTSEQFVSGPAFTKWLTSDEKKAITNYQRDKKITVLPKHLSNSLDLRKKIPLKFNGTCFDTKKLFTTSRDHCSTYGILGKLSLKYNVTCLHVIGLFRVKEDCEFLGLTLPSQQDNDNTVLSPILHVYNEDIKVTVNDCGTSLKLNNPCMELVTKKYTQETQYNSTISINFDQAVKLSSDKWYEIKVDVEVVDGIQGKYPDVLMTNKCSSDGIEFIFHTEQLQGHRTSMNVNFIRSLILSPNQNSILRTDVFSTLWYLFLNIAFLLLVIYVNIVWSRNETGH
jgi:hypothetical protein